MENRIVIGDLEIDFSNDAKRIIMEHLPYDKDYHVSPLSPGDDAALDTLIKYQGQIVGIGAKYIEVVENNEIKSVLIYCPLSMEYNNPYDYDERDLFLSWGDKVIQKLKEKGVQYVSETLSELLELEYGPLEINESWIREDYEDDIDPIVHIWIDLPLNNNVYNYLKQVDTQNSKYDIIMIYQNCFRVIDKEYYQANARREKIFHEHYPIQDTIVTHDVCDICKKIYEKDQSLTYIDDILVCKSCLKEDRRFATCPDCNKIHFLPNRKVPYVVPEELGNVCADCLQNYPICPICNKYIADKKTYEQGMCEDCRHETFGKQCFLCNQKRYPFHKIRFEDYETVLCDRCLNSVKNNKKFYFPE